MNSLLSHLAAGGSLLAAAEGPLNDLGRHFRPSGPAGPGDELLGMLLLAGLLISGAVLLARYLKVREQRRRCCPKYLFQELCRAHQLSRGQQRLLWQLSRRQQLSHPAGLFLAPERFAPDDLGPGGVEHAERLEALRQELFADNRTPRPAGR